MSSISEQLASFRDVKNKKLRRFLSEYRSKLPWNTCKVSNSYNYLRSLDESFEKYESLFSDSLFGLSSLSFSDTNENNDIDIFRESKDIEFMTSEELSELNKLIGSFIQHTVQYFLNENTEILIDYLIFKYDIASRFREELIASYIQYYNSPYYCKLLSLITIENGTAFYPLYERIKDVTVDFTECKYVTLNLVVSEIVKSFSIYKQVSTCYNKLSRSNSSSISFFNFVNAQYIITNGPTIDDNELRYIINMIIGGLTVDNIEYLNSQMCSMISLFSSVQLQVSVQNEIIKMCKFVLNKIVETDLSEYGLVFRNFVLVLMFMLHNQTQTLEKLPHEITIPLVNIINKKSVRQVFFDIKKSKKSLDFSIFTNTLFHSLVSYYVKENSEQITTTLQTIDYENRIISDIKNFLQFVKETDLNCVKQIVIKIVYELNKINSRIKTHNESMITFRIDGFELALNPKIKYLPTVLLLGHSIEILRDLSPNILERTLMEYINRLDYEQLKRNIEVILYIYHRKSNNLSTIIMILYNRYSYQLDNFKPIKLDKLDSIHSCLTIFEEIELQTLKDSVINSFIDIIVSTYDNIVPEFNYYLSNFLSRLNEYPELFSKLYSNERFISSIPSVYSLNSILLQIQRIIEEIDSSYQCELDGKFECENIEELLMSKYVLHILNNKNGEDLFKKLELFLKVYSASDESTKKIVSEFISPYIHFIKSALNYTDSEYKDIFTVNLVNMVDMVDIEDWVLNNLIKLVNNSGNNDVYVDVGVDQLSGLFTPFCTLFYLVKSIEHVIKSCSDVQYMQMVLIMELLSKYVKSDVSDGIKSVVYEVYGLIFGKYELKLCELHSKRSPLITVKRIQIILNDEQLYNQFKGQDLRVNEYSQYVFELFRITSHQKEFKVFYKQGKILSAERFKHFMGLEYNKILKDNTLIQYLSKNVEYNQCGDGEDGNYYTVNLDYSVESIDNGCDFVIRLFKNCSNDMSYEVYLDLLIRILDLIYTATSEYLGQFTKLLYQLSNEFKNTNVDRLTNKVTKKAKSTSVDVDLKCDVRKLVNQIIGQDISVQGYEHNLISVIENNITGDEQLFKAFMIKFFTSGSKCVFNTVFADKVIELIDGSGFQVSFLLKILYQIGLKMELELESCKIWNELTLVRLGEFLSTTLVLLQTKKVDENEQEFGVLTNLIIKLGTKYKKWELELKESEQKLDNKNLVKFLSNHVDDTCLVVLNKYKSGIFWKFGEELRNSIYSSFLQLSKYSRAKYINMSLEWLFKFKESDENMILLFIEQLIRTKLPENVITNLIRNLQSLKSYEVLVQKLLSSSLRLKIKLLNLCKIIHHFTISRNLSNEDFQFIFRNTNILLEHYCKIENSKYDDSKTLNQSLNKQTNSKKKTSFVTGIINLITRHKVETEVVQTESNDTEDDSEDIELFNSIVMYLKQLLERLCTMFGKVTFEKSIYNSLYHGVCSFIKKSIVLMGADSVKFINKLIHNLMVCDVRISLDNKELEEVVRNTVTSTVNNILNFDENTPSVVLELLNGSQGKFDLVRTIYTSYLIYTYIYTVIRSGNCTNTFKFPEIFQLVNSGEYFSILSTLVFINLKMLDTKNEILNELKGYQILDFKVKNKSTEELEQVSTQVFRLISELLEERKIRIQVEQSLFNKKSSTATLFMKINEFLYSLISTMVYYKHYYEKQDNPKIKITESIRTGGSMRYEGYEMIMKLILEIFRINSVGGFNLHVYGILMCIYKELEKMSDMITSDELSRILHERYDTSVLKWDVYVITNLLWLNKQSISKENVMRFKYEKEFDKVNNLTCQIMFELFKISSKIYEVDRNEDLFNQITYFRNEVWMYFITNTPSCMEYFLPIIVESLDKFELFYLENKGLDWSCLDTVYSLKLIISISKSKSGIGINYNSTIIEISEKIMKMKIGSNLSDFIQILILLLCYLLLKYFKVSLKKGFYEFCIQMALEFKSRESNGKVDCLDNSNENLDNLIENEFMGLNIDDCLNLLENTNTTSLKSLRSELLITQITYYASQSIELKSLIKLFSNQEQRPELLIKIIRLIKVISVNIRYLKPDYHEDLRNIYLICINYYTTVSSQILSEQGLISYNRTKNKPIEEILENSTKLASIFFNKSGVDLIFNFEESFLSFSINYFSLISPNSLVDLFEKQSKIYEQENLDLGNRIFLLVTLSAICEYGKYGATNLISTRLSQHFEHISEHILNEAKNNRNNIQEITFDNCLLWYKNSKLLLELVVKSIDTWNIKRGSVPDVVLNSWCKIVKNHISILDYLPINGDVEVQNITFEVSNSIEKSLIHLINGFITQDNKIIKIESCLSEQLAMKSLNIKIGSLVIMNHIWDELGVHLTPAIKNVMPLLGELVDDENEVVRRIALEVDSKVKEILYQN